VYSLYVVVYLSKNNLWAAGAGWCVKIFLPKIHMLGVGTYLWYGLCNCLCVLKVLARQSYFPLRRAGSTLGNFVGAAWNK
jgi:hypothetical protein